MSRIFNYSGEEDFYHGGIYSNPKEAGLLLSLGNHVDVFYPRKRARVNAPFVVDGVNFEQKKKKPISLDVLPDECLYEIFRHLPSNQDRSICACVSKRWLNLLGNISKEDLCTVDEIIPEIDDVEIESDGFLTRSLEGKKATDVRLAAIAVGASGRGGLGKLIIKGTDSVRGVTNLGLRAIARCCPTLKVLSLWNVRSVGDEGLIEIAKGCPNLEKLDLCHCPSVTAKALLSIAKNCQRLTTLNLEGCQRVGNEGLQAIGQLCPNLKSVIVKDCHLVTDQGIASFISTTSTTLTKLKLQGLNLTDLSLAVIGHYGKSITDLVLSNLQSVNERGFWVMGNAQGLQHLKSFTISSCRGITDVSLEAIGKGCPNLKQFVLKKCAFLSDSGLVSFVKSVGSLETLQLEECHRITQIGFLGLLLNCGPKFKALTMTNCFGFRDMVLGFPLPNVSTPLRSLVINNCPGLGDMTLAMLAKLCPQLQHINFNGLQGITDTGLLSLIDSCEAGAGLTKVSLTGCINVSDNVVISLAKIHGGTLEVLNLDGCGKVTDASLTAIADDCLILSELHLSKCGISDVGVASLARSKHLCIRILSFSGCPTLSDKCLPFLVQLGRSLVGLNLQFCNNISSSVIDMLENRLFRCDILS